MSKVPSKRKNRHTFVQLICIAILFIGVYCREGFENICSLAACCYLCLFFLEIIYRLTYFVEEIYHLQSRYENNLWKLLAATFTFNTYSIISFIITALYTIFKYEKDFNLTWACIFSAAHLYANLTALFSSPLRTAKIIDHLGKLDYGSGMAFSYFYGYLNIVLPCTGGEAKGFLEKLNMYEARERIAIKCKKLFILIPLSGYCPKSLADVSKRMEACKLPEKLIQNKAGVKARVYHHTLYKIETEEENVYVCAEYASPMQTLHDIISRNNSASHLYQKYRMELVTNFYWTLRELIESNRDVRDICELIIYNDEICRDISDILLDRINCLVPK